MTEFDGYFNAVDNKSLRKMSKLLEIRNVRLNFALDHHVNSKGQRMNFIEYPHIREIYETISPSLTLQGSVQCFKSEFAIVDHLAMAYSGLSVFFVLPKVETRTTYVQNRVDKGIQSVPFYKEIVGEGAFDSVFLKQFGKGVIKYISSNVFSDFREFPADAFFVDEVDECDQKNLDHTWDRVRASDYQFSRYLGNPDLPKEGINRHYLESDQREWYVPCLSCGKYAEANWFSTVVRELRDKQGSVIDCVLRDTEWRPGIRRDIHMICPTCGGILNRASKNGKWLQHNPQSTLPGYHLSMLISLINSVSGMWSRFRKAQGDLVLMRSFYRSELGLPYASMGNKITEELLRMCTVPNYNFVIEEDCAHIADNCHVGPCTMGIDVGTNFDVRISYITNRGSRLCVYIGKVKSVDELHDLMDRYNVKIAVMDAEPEMSLSKEVQDTAKNTAVWLNKYRYSAGVATSKVVHEDDMTIHVDRTEAMDNCFSHFRKKKNMLPENFKDILGGNYVDEMCGPVRQATEDKNGRRRYEWTPCVDHQFHSDTYDRVATELFMDNQLEAFSG